MGPKKPYDTEKLPTGILNIVTTIFGFIFLVGLLELSTHRPQNVLGASTSSTTTLEIIFVALIIFLALCTILFVKSLKRKKN